LIKPAAPPFRQRRGLEIDTVDTEAVQLLERGELSCHTFDQIRQVGRLSVGLSDGKDVDRSRHGRRRRQLLLVERAEDGLGTDDDDLITADDLTGRADGVLQLIAAHQDVAASSSIT
jgi:hypothetical protein